MSASLSQLDNRVFLGLEPAGEYLSVEDVHNAVVQRLNTRTMQSRTSDINVLLGTSSTFTPTTIPYDVTALIGKSVPCWLEVQADTVGGQTWWHPVRNVSLVQLTDYRNLGAFACAFYGEEPSSDTAQPTQYLSFTYLPARTCRIRFDRDGQRTAMTSDILLPDNLSELVVLEAQNSLIPRIKTAITVRTRKDSESVKYAAELKRDLDGILMQNMLDIRPLDAQWRVWAFRDRSAQPAFNKPTPSSENLYPGGRNNTWGTYGGGY